MRGGDAERRSDAQPSRARRVKARAAMAVERAAAATRIARAWREVVSGLVWAAGRLVGRWYGMAARSVARGRAGAAWRKLRRDDVLGPPAADGRTLARACREGWRSGWRGRKEAVSVTAEGWDWRGVQAHTPSPGGDRVRDNARVAHGGRTAEACLRGWREGACVGESGVIGGRAAARAAGKTGVAVARRTDGAGDGTGGEDVDMNGARVARPGTARAMERVTGTLVWMMHEAETTRREIGW